MLLSWGGVFSMITHGFFYSTFLERIFLPSFLLLNLAHSEMERAIDVNVLCNAIDEYLNKPAPASILMIDTSTITAARAKDCVRLKDCLKRLWARLLFLNGLMHNPDTKFYPYDEYNIVMHKFIQFRVLRDRLKLAFKSAGVE